MKRFLLATYAIFNTVLLNAWEYDCNPYSNAFSCSPPYIFAVHFSPAYLQPIGNSPRFGAEEAPLQLPLEERRIHKIKPEYHFGFNLTLEYVSKCRNTNMTLNWTHFQSEDSAFRRADRDDTIGPVFASGLDGTHFCKAKGHLIYHLDEIDLNYGLYSKFGRCLQTNIYAGIAGAYIQQKLESRFSNHHHHRSRRKIKMPSRFLGAGPQIGLNYSCRVWRCLHLTGSGSAAFLIGSHRSRTDLDGFPADLKLSGMKQRGKQSTKEYNKTECVPELAGRLGMAYYLTLGRHFQLNLELGYEACIYFNAIQSADISSKANSDVRSFHKTRSNFALAGPYAQVTVGF